MNWLVVYPELHLSIAVNINTRARTFAAFAEVEDEIAALFVDRIEQLEQQRQPVTSQPEDR